MQSTRVLKIFIIGLLTLVSQVDAATRTVSFFQIANSSASFNGFASARTTRCLISIYNPSSTTQTYTVTAPVSATGIRFSCTGNVAAGVPCSPASAVTEPASLTGSLTQDSSVTLTWTYPSFPASTTGDMTFICTGSIAVADNSGNLGFVQANGEITVWVEEGTAIQGANTISGGAKVNSVKIFIEDGRMF